MSVSLKKGQGVSLKKDSGHDLSMLTIGLGWDEVKPTGGHLKKMFGGKTEEYDLDAIAFLLDNNGHVTNLGWQNGKASLVGGDVVFFNSMRHPSGAIWLTGDNRTGAGDGDDEQIIVKLDALPSTVQSILFLTSIYQGRQKNQNFGGVANAFIRAEDAKGKEICRFDISTDPASAQCCSLKFAELRRESNGWKFNAIGIPEMTDNFVDILRDHLPN